MTRTEVKPTISAVKDLMAQEPDALREIVRSVMQTMLEAEMDEALGAGKSERNDTRLGYRSGYYTRTLVTRVGKLELRVPQDRAGRFSTELFERYQRSEQALVATLAEMYVQGVSTRKSLSRRRPGSGRSLRNCAAMPFRPRRSRRSTRVERSP
jgi:transposase-like protein